MAPVMLDHCNIDVYDKELCMPCGLLVLTETAKSANQEIKIMQNFVSKSSEPLLQQQFSPLLSSTCHGHMTSQDALCQNTLAG